MIERDKFYECLKDIGRFKSGDQFYCRDNMPSQFWFCARMKDRSVKQLKLGYVDMHRHHLRNTNKFNINNFDINKCYNEILSEHFIDITRKTKLQIYLNNS